MEVTWEVEDGYAGQGRPQITEVPDDEIAECDTVEAAMELINEHVKEDFDNQVSFGLRFGDQVEVDVAALLEGKS